MKQLTINIKDNRFKTFIEFIRTLDYVEIEDDIAMNELRSSLKQVKLMKEGKLKKQSAEDLINEL